MWCRSAGASQRGLGAVIAVAVVVSGLAFPAAAHAAPVATAPLPKLLTLNTHAGSEGRGRVDASALPEHGSARVLVGLLDGTTTQASIARGEDQNGWQSFSGLTADGVTVAVARRAQAVVVTTDSPSGSQQATSRDGGATAIVTQAQSLQAETDPVASRFPALAGNAASTASAPTNSAGQYVIDVVNAWTPLAASEAGGADMMEAKGVAAIALTNLSLSNSRVNAQVRLVGSVQVTSKIAETNGTAVLDALANPSDGNFDEATALRDRLGADEVALFVSKTVGVCGQAYQNTEPNPAHNVLLVSQSCPARSYAHEFGHTLGAGHDAYVDAASTPWHGYIDLQHRFMTTMAYTDECDKSHITCAGIPYYSNPDVTFNGWPVGTVTANNAKIMNQNAAAVAGARTSTVNGTPQLSFTPAPNAVLETPPAQLAVQFSTAVSGVTASTLRLEGKTGAPIAASVAYDAATHRATLTPTASLPNDATYLIAVKPGITDNASGNAVPAQASSFQVSQELKLLSMSPVDGTGRFTLRFNKPGVTGYAWASPLDTAGDAVWYVHDVDPADPSVLRWIPASPSLPGTRYTVTANLSYDHGDTHQTLTVTATFTSGGTAPAPSISIVTDAVQVPGGAAVPYRGQVIGARAGQTVILDGIDANGSYRGGFATATTDGNGHWSVTSPWSAGIAGPDGTGYTQVRAATCLNGTWYRTDYPAGSFHRVNRVTITSPNANQAVPAGQPLTIKGTVTPARPGVQVVLDAQDVGGANYQGGVATAVSDAAGNWSATINAGPAARGTRQVRAAVYDGWWSRSDYITYNRTAPTYTLTQNPIPTVVSGGQRITFSGKISPAAAGWLVVIDGTINGTYVSQLATTTTNADGSYSVTTAWGAGMQNTHFTARAAVATRDGWIRGSDVSYTRNNTVTVASTANKTVSGSVGPARAGVPVVLDIQNVDGSNYQGGVTTVYTDANGNWSAPATWRTGTYQVRAAVCDGWWSRSDYTTITV